MPPIEAQANWTRGMLSASPMAPKDASPKGGIHWPLGVGERKPMLFVPSRPPVEPKTGKTYWYLIPRVNTKWLNLVLKTFAAEAGASPQKIILLVQDRAGWHTSKKVKLPASLVTELLPPYSPELQPAERLWSLVDEPLVNAHFESIDQLENVLAARCCILQEMTDEIKNLTHYHWLNYS